MSAFKEHPIFASALTACTLFMLGESWCIYDRWTAAREAAVTLERKTTELHAIGAFVPVPTRAVAGAIEADLARAEKALSTMANELQGRGPAAERRLTAHPPATRTDAYFDLATFVEQTRALARKQEVDLKPDAARFGFASYANEGPDVEHIPTVFQQRLVAQYLIESLLAARPRSLLSVQREHMLTKAEREARDAALRESRAAAETNGTPPEAVPAANFAGPSEAADFFVIDPRASAQVQGHLETTAFRIAFTGQTAVLRAFLNKLASFELPVLVREVEVVPATGEEAAIAPTAEEAPAPEPAAASIVLTTEATAPPARATKGTIRKAVSVPIIMKPLSKFTVTVEYIVLVPAATAAAAAESNPAKPSA